MRDDSAKAIVAPRVLPPRKSPSPPNKQSMRDVAAQQRRTRDRKCEPGRRQPAGRVSADDLIVARHHVDGEAVADRERGENQQTIDGAKARVANANLVNPNRVGT